MVSAVVDRGNGGPREWWTPGMADPNRLFACYGIGSQQIRFIYCTVLTTLEFRYGVFA